MRSDPQLLRRVLQNYLSNAIRYTPPGGRILMGCRRRGPALRVLVCDTGIGIPEDKQREVFQEFQRLDADDGARDRGLGLGLAIVDRIARLLGHDIALISVPGRGTGVGIDVPLATRRAVRVMPRADRPAEPDSAGRLILCIDNETAILKALEAILEQWGYRVVSARDTETALGVLGGAVPDLVLIDYHLDAPLTGTGVLDRLRGAWQREVDALIVTADRGAGVLEEAEARGCRVLYKPVKPASLRRFLTAAALRNAASGEGRGAMAGHGNGVGA